MEPAWDHATLKAWFLARPGEDVAETDILRAFFPAEDLFEGGVGLELFHKHFLLYRRLWLFDDELRLTTGQRLWIRGIRSTLLDPPVEGCRWLDAQTGQFCGGSLRAGSLELCSQHDSTVPEVDSMKSYYLDWKNLEGMTEEGLRELVEGFFRWMGSRGNVAQALQVLGLPNDAPAGVIKARWRKLSLDHHPDRGGDPVHFQELSAAWAVLKSLES